MKNNLSTQKQHKYPDWYWICRYRNRIVIKIIGALLFLTAAAVLVANENQIFMILLVPFFIALLLLGNDNNFKRGHVPELILKRMAYSYSPNIETKFILKRAYEKSAQLAPKDPHDLWLSDQYLQRSFEVLAEREQASQDKYMKLYEHIKLTYY